MNHVNPFEDDTPELSIEVILQAMGHLEQTTMQLADTLSLMGAKLRVIAGQRRRP